MAEIDPIGATLMVAVMAGLDPAIQARLSLVSLRPFNKASFLDCRFKPGNDGREAFS